MHTQKDLERFFRAMDLDTQKKRAERSDFGYCKPDDDKNTEEKWFYYLDISTKSEDEESVCRTGMK